MEGEKVKMGLFGFKSTAAKKAVGRAQLDLLVFHYTRIKFLERYNAEKFGKSIDWYKRANAIWKKVEEEAMKRNNVSGAANWCLGVDIDRSCNNPNFWMDGGRMHTIDRPKEIWDQDADALATFLEKDLLTAIAHIRRHAPPADGSDLPI
ncbi:hypothetical protein CR51_22895 [Caballeronia megalochromosomata]|nr:hypothetical protein CR51_22895 [Caballeronia megalochromosomata]